MGKAKGDRTVRVRRPPLTPPQKTIATLALVILLVGLGNLVRAGVALYYAGSLPGMPMSVSWSYLAANGLLWGLALVGTALGLTRQRRWSRLLALAVPTLYQAHEWANHLLFDASDYARQIWPRDAVLTVLFLAAVWGVLCWPSIRKAFD